MKARIAAIAAVVSSLAAVACGQGVSARPPHFVPMMSLTEAQDEWLHEHCEPKGVFSVDSIEEGEPVIRARSANFAEIVHTDRSFHAVAFACRARPEWAGAATWVPLEAVAQRGAGGAAPK